MYADGMAVNECNRNIVFACECVRVRLCFVCGACIQEHSSMCGWCLLVKTVCMYLWVQVWYVQACGVCLCVHV